MHISYWMILIASFLAYLAVGGAKSQANYNNAAPCTYFAQLQGWRARADSAHRNHFEAFPALLRP